MRAAKHGRTRLVPLHESTCRVLADYTDQRRRHRIGRPVSQNLFLSSTGKPLEASQVKHTFRKLSRHVGLRGPDDRRGPRLHDFPPHAGGEDIGELVPGGPGSGQDAADSVHLPGACARFRYLLVPRKQPRADERSHEMAGAPLEGSLMKGANIDQPASADAAVLHPATDTTAPGESPHHRILPGLVQAVPQVRVKASRPAA